VLVAKGQAEGNLAQMQAEAEGLQATLDAKAEGYRALVTACGSDPSLTAALLLIEKLSELASIQTDAVKNLPLEKIVVWDGGGNGGGMADLGKRLMGVLPPLHELAKAAGLELPEYLGKATSDTVTPASRASKPAPSGD
jgi:flotillin